ncbi:hypothetical protein ACFS27_27945 [Promicromonospora vindobonensis]|uniref:Uncharacterized protein n=1 Tax=Promicromonospora vindobonensis TaxID=195748 RepID=A0ABW5W0J3_9MICO
MIAATPEMPSDDPGALLVVTGIVAALAACFFAFWVLGGYRFFIGRVEDLENPWDLVRRSVPVLLVLLVTTGLFLGAYWLDDRERDAAWDRYDDQLNQQEETVEAP